MNNRQTCINCGHLLVDRNGVWLCPLCNADRQVYSQPFFDMDETDQYTFIECPGATLYEPDTNRVIEGVKFIDSEDSSKGHKIIIRPVFPPAHRRRRRIKREAAGKIRRCQACQDYTIRMRRPEGPDFFIPSAKHPGRKKLRSITVRSYV